MRRKKYMWSAVCLLYVAFVFHNSLTPATESSAQSSFVLEKMLGVMNAVGLEHVGVTEHIIRKLAHFGEYTVLGLMLWRCLAFYWLPGRERWLVHGTLGFLAPFVDETIQLFVEGRSGQISDVWLDVSGVAFGTVLFISVSWLRRHVGKGPLAFVRRHVGKGPLAFVRRHVGKKKKEGKVRD